MSSASEEAQVASLSVLATSTSSIFCLVYDTRTRGRRLRLVFRAKKYSPERSSQHDVFGRLYLYMVFASTVITVLHTLTSTM
jgi:hypothetical protein